MMWAVDICGWTIDLAWPGVGTIPDWLAAIGTVGTLFYLVRGLNREREHRREDQQRIEDEHRDARAAQARLVTVTWQTMGSITVQLTVHNDSDGPITKIRGGLLALVDRDGGGRWTEYPGELSEPDDRIGGHGKAELVLRADTIFLEQWEARSFLTFTDARGLRWRREDNDLPTRLIEA